MHVVIDTHALLWYLTDSPQLSRGAAEVFQEIENGEKIAVISAIVLLECIDILDKKKVALSVEFLMRVMSNTGNFMLAPIDWNTILETAVLKGFTDLHDRVIVATARLYSAPIVSRDRIIKEMHNGVIW